MEESVQYGRCTVHEGRRAGDQRVKWAGARVDPGGSTGHRKDSGFPLSEGGATEGFEHSKDIICFTVASTSLCSLWVWRTG